MYNQISTFLTVALSLGAAVTALPSGVTQRSDQKNCSDISFGDFKWQVTNFVYNASYVFTTPAHQNSWGYVNFDLSNPAFAAGSGKTSESACSAASSRLNDFFYGDTPYTCASTDDRRTSTFDFDRASGSLTVNDSWMCQDVDPEFPTVFTAIGKTELKLDCTNTTYNNPNWTIGDVYSSTQVTCKPVNLVLKPYEITAVA